MSTPQPLPSEHDRIALANEQRLLDEVDRFREHLRAVFAELPNVPGTPTFEAAIAARPDQGVSIHAELSSVAIELMVRSLAHDPSVSLPFIIRALNTAFHSARFVMSQRDQVVRPS